MWDSNSVVIHNRPSTHMPLPPPCKGPDQIKPEEASLQGAQSRGDEVAQEGITRQMQKTSTSAFLWEEPCLSHAGSLHYDVFSRKKTHIKA